MTFLQLITPFPWTRYSKKLQAKIERPLSIGVFSKEEAEARDLRLSIGKEGDSEEGNSVKISFLIDKDDGIIVDAKFQAFGGSALIGAAESVCQLVIGKNYDQASRMTLEVINSHVKDKSNSVGFPKETYPYISLVLVAVEKACKECLDLPLSLSYIAPPAPLDMGDVREGGYPGFKELTLDQQLALIEEVLNQEVRPYIAMDGGGITLLNLINGQEVVISYQGSCTSCYSSVGTTLSFIQQTLKAKIHPSLSVTPELGDMFKKLQ